jgi:protein involved in polysaccharide export with SLBB domain
MILALASCSSPVVTHPAPSSDLYSGFPAHDEPYVINPGDELDLKFFFVPDLNTVALVRPDGKISVMFAGDITAAGNTPLQLHSIIEKKLSAHMKQPDMMVSVKTMGSQKVYVGGEVLKAGVIQLSGHSSLMQVLNEAGWLTPSASKEEIIILRRTDGGREKIYHVNTAKIMSGEDPAQNVRVLAGDVILVPPSAPVEFDRWMDRNVRSALPFGMGASYNYTNYYKGPESR